MPRRFALIVSIILIAPRLAAFADVNEPAVKYADIPGPYKVDAVRYDWIDKCRNRPVPVKIYYPADCNRVCPLIIFSHGLGSSREGYEYLGRQWASYGYVSAHVQHKGSDGELIIKDNHEATMAALRKAANFSNACERPKDVSFAITEMAKLNNEPGIFKNHLDMNEIGVAGHSFGAYTALAVAGQKLGVWFLELSFTDPRVKAVIAMSPPYINWQSPQREFGSITVPLMVLTGTLDESPLKETSAKDRRLPFDNAKSDERYLITFNGGDHMTFSGHWKQGNLVRSESDAHFQSLIKPATVAFWDAYLKDDARAKTWLKNGCLGKLMGVDAAIEIK